MKLTGNERRWIIGWCSSRRENDGGPGPTGRYVVGRVVDPVIGWLDGAPLERLREQDHDTWDRLVVLAGRLEETHRAPVQFEFETNEHGLRVTRTRRARMRARPFMVAIHDLVGRGVISVEEGVRAVHPNQVRTCLTSRAVSHLGEPVGRGLGVSPGVGSGRAVFGVDDAEQLSVNGELPVLIVDDLSPEHIGTDVGLAAVVTLSGGATSHAAVVAKSLGLPMIASVRDAELVCGSGLRIGPHIVNQHDLITVDGTQGTLHTGAAEITDQTPPPELLDLIQWADRHRTIQVYANADSPEEVRRAVAFGAAGVGLCRLEHVLAHAGQTARLRDIRQEQDVRARTLALEGLVSALTAGLVEILLAAGSRPVTIRLIDMPDNELPPGLEREGGWPEASESNPMMGRRGVRDFIVNADLAAAQLEAIAGACRTVSASGVRPDIRLLIPMATYEEELRISKRLIEDILGQVVENNPVVGCMIEVPRLALRAAELVQDADFLSIGSNDLTQFVLAMSRDDAETRVLEPYIRNRLVAENPFRTLDRDGVGRLLEICVTQARGRCPDVAIGLCGEHADDPSSIDYLVSLGLDYLSCSAGQVLLTRFSVARSQLERPETH